MVDQNGVAAREELVQPERKDREPAGLIAAKFRAAHQELPQERCTLPVGVGPGPLGELVRRAVVALQSTGSLPDQTTRRGFCADAKRRFNPGRQWVEAKRFVVSRSRRGRVDRRGEFRNKSWAAAIDFLGRTL